MSRVEEALKRNGGPLLGASVSRYDPVYVDMAGMLGFDVMWIEMEHMSISFSEAVDLCRIASGAGLLTMIRVPDARRENVLKAAECGPHIIDLPMANSPEIVREFVQHARYTPEGNRGFFSATRAMRYGLGGGVVEEQQRVNRELCLMVQIETREAVECVDEICQVPGFEFIFLGRGDLSSSLGVTGQTEHPDVMRAVDRSIDAAKRAGKLASSGCAPSEVRIWAEKGLDLIFVAGDLGCLRSGLQDAIRQARDSLG